MNKFSSTFWRKLRIVPSFIEIMKRDYVVLSKHELDWLLTQGDIFKIPLPSLMTRVSHYALLSFLLMEENKKGQFNHHSHSRKLSMSPQIMETKANKTNKNKITNGQKNLLKKKAMCFSPCFLYHLTFPSFNKFDFL